LAKPHFFGKKYTASKQFETPMNMEITIVKTFCDFGHNVFKKQAFWPFFYQDFGHKLRKKSGNPGSAYSVAMRKHFSFAFVPFFLLQVNFFPLRLRLQTSA